MDKRTKRWAILIVCCAACWGIAMFALKGNSHSGVRMGYVENSIGNKWTASYAYFHGHTNRTVRGDVVLSGSVSTKDGELDILVTDQEGNPVFFRENVGTDSFEVPISGTVKVTITAHKHRGGFTLQWE